MNWISAIFFAIAGLIVLTMLRRDADVLSPARVFGLTWALVFALTNLKFSRLQFEWSPMQWIVVALGPLAFLGGVLISYFMNSGNTLLTVRDVRREFRKQFVDERILFNGIVLLFIVYLVGYFIINGMQGSLPIFSANPSAARTEFSAFGIGLFIHHVPVIVILSAMYHLLVSAHPVKKFALKVIAAVSVILYLFLLQRYHLMMSAALVFVLLYYSSDYIKFRTVLLFGVIAIVLIYLIATLRAGKLIQMALYVTSAMKFPPQYAIFTEPYMYVCMNVENYVNAVSKLDHFTYGYYTFNFALASTGLKHWIEEYYAINDTPFLFSGYNTYTLFWNYYRDFGLFGISIIPLVGGIFVGSLYYSIRRAPRAIWVALYCIIVFVMGMSFFVNLLGYLWFIYLLAWLLVILKLATRQGSHSMA
jgi:oligosaccharide repeat unit polymerase